MFLEVYRGYLPENYYADKHVFKRKPPMLQVSNYPNKIEVDMHRCFAILVKGTNARLQDAYEWMAAHPYIQVRYIASTDSERLTGNIAVEAYSSIDRAYVMIVFRAATVNDEHTNQMLESHGMSRKGPCPPPVTGLLCRSGVNIQSIWQWLSLHRGRLAYLVNEPILHTNIAIVQSGRLQLYAGHSTTQLIPQGAVIRHDRSHDSFESGLPAYEPPPPSIHGSIPEPNALLVDSLSDEDEGYTPPAYWDVVRQTECDRAYVHSNSGRFTQSMPMFPESIVNQGTLSPEIDTERRTS
ncbi:hypothetical protein EV180_005915, partial [Coemansia sp. RSA 518]